MAQAFIADSDDSEEDGDPYALPSSPPSKDAQTHPFLGLERPNKSQNIDENTSSTDPLFFQSVLDEQKEAVKVQTSALRPRAEAEDVKTAMEDESQLPVERLTSSEMTAPEPFHRTVTAFDVSMASSATNPATQRQLARVKSRLEQHDPWSIPDSSDEEDGGPWRQRLAFTAPTATAEEGIEEEEPGRRKRRKIGETNEDDIDLVALPASLKSHEMPSTLPFTQSVSQDGVVRTEANTEAIGQEFGRGPEIRKSLPKTSKGVERYSLSDTGDPLLVRGVEKMAPHLDQQVDEVPTPTEASRRRRHSSPDVFAHPEPVRKDRSHRKRLKSKDGHGDSLLTGEADFGSQRQQEPAKIEDEAKPQPERKKSKSKSSRARALSLDHLEDGDDGFHSDTAAVEIYGEEEYDDDFVEGRPKQKKQKKTNIKSKRVTQEEKKKNKDEDTGGTTTKKRGRPKKLDHEEVAQVEDAMPGEDGDVESAKTLPAKKRGRPRKSDTALENKDTLVADNDDTHEFTKNGQSREEPRGDTEEIEDRTRIDEEVKEKEETVEEEHTTARKSKPLPAKSSKTSVESNVAEEPSKNVTGAVTIHPMRLGPSDGKSPMGGAAAAPGKPVFRVGLSKRSRIAPLLKSLKKP